MCQALKSTPLLFHFPGGLPPLAFSELPDVLCAETAIVGLDKSLFPFGYLLPLASDWVHLGEARRQLTAYKAWLIGRLGLQGGFGGGGGSRRLPQHEASGNGTLQVLLSVRGGSLYRKASPHCSTPHLF